jgi:hypothetical protein
MQMRDWKVGNRIMLGFVAVIALTVAVGLFAYSKVLIIEHDSNDIANNNVPSVIALGHVQVELYHIVELLLQHAASGDQHEMDALEEQIRQLHGGNLKAYQKYEALPTTPEEAVLYNKVKLDRVEFWSILEEARNNRFLPGPSGTLTKPPGTDRPHRRRSGSLHLARERHAVA